MTTNSADFRHASALHFFEVYELISACHQLRYESQLM